MNSCCFLLLFLARIIEGVSSILLPNQTICVERDHSKRENKKKKKKKSTIGYVTHDDRHFLIFLEMAIMSYIAYFRPLGTTSEPLDYFRPSCSSRTRPNEKKQRKV